MTSEYYETRLREAQDLLRAVLLFHSAGPWTDEKQHDWYNTIQNRIATTKNLCNAIRAHLEGVQITPGIHGEK